MTKAPEETYPTTEHMERFRRLIEANVATVLGGASRCLRCGGEIPKSMYWCSKECCRGIKRIPVRPRLAR